MAEDHRPPQGSVIDAWADGLRTRLVTAHRVDRRHLDRLYLSRWEDGRWVPAGSISRTASWRIHQSEIKCDRSGPS